MKKLTLLLLLIVSTQVFAQTPNAVPPNQQTVVKDESGMLLPYVIWQKMVQSGDYGLKIAEPGATSYVAYKLSAKERERAAERRKSFVSSLSKPAPSPSFKEGQPFREKITDMNGNKYDLRKPDGKIYVVNFWFINCPPCKKEIPELNEIVTKYKDHKDVVFLAIALDQYQDLKDFLKSSPFLYHVVDDGRYYASRYGVKSYPTHVILGKDGLVKFSTLGLALNTVSWIEKTIEEQLAAN